MMGLFNKLKKMVRDEPVSRHSITLLAPLSGELVSLEAVPDIVFSEKVVGDGVAIKPSGHKIVAPCNGVISKIFASNHAFAMRTESGLELFIHFGVDTIELEGKGFTRIADEGQTVNTGDTIIEFDLPLLEATAKSTLTSIIISNMDDITELTPHSGAVTLATDTILSIKK